MRLILPLPALLLFLAPAFGQDDIQRAKIKKLDIENKVVTLTIAEKDHDYLLSEQTRLVRSEHMDFKDRFADFKPGTPVMYRVAKRDGKDYLVGIKIVAAGQPNPRAQPKMDTSKLKPLTEMGDEEYQGFKGGLYPDGKNERPAAHETAGLALAKEIQPRDADGKPSPDGKIVILSVGMSNTSQVSGRFEKIFKNFKDRNPRVVFVNGAQGGMTAAAIKDPEDNSRGTQYWTTVDARLKQAGLTREQVQVIWIKQANAGPSQGFPKYAKTLQEQMAQIVQLFPKRFPNAKLVYLSSRTYGGYATTGLNPDPYAYESGFSVRWLIEDQIKGDVALNYDPKKGEVKAPWLSWGPYLWANGMTKRADGFFYEQSDFGPDGTHPSSSGQEKAAQLLLRFFQEDSTTRTWFLAKDKGQK
jgi:hypothetical protein